MEKYTLNTFNGFASYCNTNAGEEGFMDRIMQKSLTNEDFASMQTFLEESPEGGLFFTPNELTDFIRLNVH